MHVKKFIHAIFVIMIVLIYVYYVSVFNFQKKIYIIFDRSILNRSIDIAQQTHDRVLKLLALWRQSDFIANILMITNYILLL